MTIRSVIPAAWLKVQLQFATGTGDLRSVIAAGLVEADIRDHADSPTSPRARSLTAAASLKLFEEPDRVRE